MQETTKPEDLAAVGVKRGLSEKRRLQNRVAQRKYRERMRSRMEDPESVRVSAEAVEDDLAASKIMDIVTSTQHERDLGACIDTHNNREPKDHAAFSELLDSSFSIDNWSGELGSVGLDFSTEMNTPFELNLRTPKRGLEDSSTPDLNMDFSSYFDHLSAVDLGNCNFSTMLDPSANTSYQRSVETTEFSSKLQPQRPQRNTQMNSMISSPLGNGPSVSDLASGIIKHLRLDDTNETKSLVKTTIARGHNIRDVLLAGLAVLGKDQQHFQVSLPSPQKTTLTLFRLPTLQAYMSVAGALGLELPEVKPHDWQTVFHRPQVLISGDFSEVMSSYDTLPLHIRPTPSQILYPHIAWIDLIPFPRLRDRLILEMYGNNSSLSFDSEEFKDDLFMSNGLFCWRSSEKGGSGQPWDMRSWEAEPWFLHKWENILGGENGEVWRQTQWWRSMRGKGSVKSTKSAT